MKKCTPIAVLFVSSALVIGACGKKDEESGNKKGQAASKTAGNAPAAKVLKPATIASLKLQIDVPEGSDVQDKTESAHFPTATIYASPTIFITGANEMFWKADVAKQKAEIEKQPGNKFKKFTKEENSEGGFHLEFELSSMMDEKETLYGFHIRTTIGETQFDCNSNTSSPEEMAKGVAMCKSLRSQ